MVAGDVQFGEVTTSTMRLWRGDDDIIRAVSYAGAHMTLEDAVENIQACARLAGQRRLPVQVDLRPIGSADSAARRYYAGGEVAEVCSVVALLIGSPVSRVLGNFFLTVDRPVAPMRLFTDEAEALAWLRRFLPTPGGDR
ncbi:MAG: hypothetical protein HYS27_15820 [Deltaproteobacteria bacterium]|nr:hypothetical protein [Deltaproteobacteria bacterium]